MNQCRLYKSTYTKADQQIYGGNQNEVEWIKAEYTEMVRETMRAEDVEKNNTMLYSRWQYLANQEIEDLLGMSEYYLTHTEQINEALCNEETW